MYGSRFSKLAPRWLVITLSIVAPIGVVALIYLALVFNGQPVSPTTHDRGADEKRAVKSAGETAREAAQKDFALIKPMRPLIPAAREAPKPLPPPVARQQPCPVSEPGSDLVIAADEETPIMLSPSPSAKPLRDPSGNQRFLDPRHDLKVLERRRDWLRVQVVSPRWPPESAGWSGWMEKKAVQRTDLPDARNCLFIDPTKWRGVAPEMQSIVREAGLRILHEDLRCRRISRGGVLAGAQRFYLTCYPSDGGRPYHYWLSPYNTPKSFALPPLIDEDAAIAQCRKKLDKILAGQAIMNQAETAAINIEAFENMPSTSAHYLALDYRTGAGEAHRAHCIVPRGGEAEITIGAE